MNICFGPSLLILAPPAHQRIQSTVFWLLADKTSGPNLTVCYTACSARILSMSAKSNDVNELLSYHLAKDRTCSDYFSSNEKSQPAGKQTVATLPLSILYFDFGFVFASSEKFTRGIATEQTTSSDATMNTTSVGESPYFAIWLPEQTNKTEQFPKPLCRRFQRSSFLKYRSISLMVAWLI